MAKRARVRQRDEAFQARVQRFRESLLSALHEDVDRMAELLASKEDDEIFGETEFEVREAVHQMGAKALQVKADEVRKKRGL